MRECDKLNNLFVCLKRNNGFKDSPEAAYALGAPLLNILPDIAISVLNLFMYVPEEKFKQFEEE